MTAATAPDLECDLVMKGGVTSGLVYPFALTKLAERYRFHSVGGASAGAIAAAFAAAAEYARSRGDVEGFARLEARCRALPGLLAGLFQPTASLKPLMRFARWAQRRGARLALGGLAAVAVTVVAATIAAIGAMGDLRDIWWVRASAVVAAVLLALGVAIGAWLAWALGVALPRHDFGLCPGLTQPGVKRPALTDWIDQALQEIAFGPGHDGPPLTFGMLRGAGIELRMVTTNLSMHRPHTLPDLGQTLLFEAAEWRRLFPARIVDFLRDEASEPETIDAVPPVGRALDLRTLPVDDLPVLVGVRMSLSFPLLISAVPLWTVDRWAELLHADQRDAARPIRFETPPKPRLRRLLFSDGGISSNFPIHFFDGPFPRRPTFALSLDELEGGMQADGPRVYLPRGAAGASFAPIRDIKGLAAFGGAILGAAKDWQDLLASLMPGQRERIARVFLGADEGGLNLDMPHDTSLALMGYGAEVGETLLADFDFDEHRWRRALVAYEALADFGVAADSGWRGGFRDWLDAYDTPKSYRTAAGPAVRGAVTTRLGSIAALGATLKPPPSTGRFPRPKGAVRITARY